ncbi:MAG: hypothetical protein GF346_08195 [Candidatus Eisenbacteria bacterium]|nr:hypothetical protein [Candidatus Latescibacterota bacterium]MBD3302413.1 hypothetical protein [Candidatus Eisenbacteria bacterium]
MSAAMKIPAMVVPLIALSFSMGIGGKEARSEDGPNLGSEVKVDKREDAMAQPQEVILYETWYAGGSVVRFNHALHVEDMGLECGYCHHMETCKHCHLDQESHTLIGNSRIALHESCFQCHEQGSSESDCLYCHETEDGSLGGDIGVTQSIQFGQEAHERVIGGMEEKREQIILDAERAQLTPAIEAPPEERLFITSHNTISTVLFPHESHAEDYGLSCGSCHHMDTCSRCHAPIEREVRVDDLETAVMDNCINCHDDLGLETTCERCHVEAHRR